MNFALKPRLFYLSIYIFATLLKAGAQISYTKEDSAKIYNICNRAAYWMNENNGLDSALWLSNGALQISQAKLFKRGEANALLKLSEILFKKSETEKVNFYNETALHTGKLLKDSFIIASAYKDMGAYYSYFSKQKEAIAYFEKALSFKYEKEQSAVTADIYNRTGNAYMEMGELDSALLLHLEKVAAGWMKFSFQIHITRLCSCSVFVLSAALQQMYLSTRKNSFSLIKITNHETFFPPAFYTAHPGKPNQCAERFLQRKHDTHSWHLFNGLRRFRAAC